MRENIKQATFLADKDLLKEFTIFCKRRERTKTSMIIGFLEDCLNKQESENRR